MNTCQQYVGIWFSSPKVECNTTCGECHKVTNLNICENLERAIGQSGQYDAFGHDYHHLNISHETSWDLIVVGSA
jgi:hypothetical protein